MKYLITGSGGFIGQALVAALKVRGDEVIAVSERARQRGHGQVDQFISLDELATRKLQIDGVVNLAGAPIMDKRWSEARKAQLRASRIDFTRRLIDQLAAAEARPEVFVSGSAIGYYGSHEGGAPLNEQGSCTPGFTHSLCRDWEQAAQEAQEQLGSRVCLLRTGIVLGPGGGALQKMLPPFQLGLGGRIGTGEQWMSWIHLEDEIAAILFLLEQHTLFGAFNLTAPGALNNQAFATALGRALNRPARLPMPALVLRLLLGESSELLLEGQRVYPTRLEEAGFVFRYPNLDQALSAAL